MLRQKKLIVSSRSKHWIWRATVLCRKTPFCDIFSVGFWIQISDGSGSTARAFDRHLSEGISRWCFYFARVLRHLVWLPRIHICFTKFLQTYFYFHAFLYIRPIKAPRTRRVKITKKTRFFPGARFWKFVSPFYSDGAKSRFPWCDVQTNFSCFLQNLCLSLELSGGVKLSFFCYRHFLFVFMVLLCAFLMKRNCAHAFFQHFFAPNADVPPTSFYVQKIQKNIDFRKYWPCSTRITRICHVFFHVRAAKSWPGYRDSIAANSHHRSPPHTGGPQVPPPWLVGAGRLDLVRGNLRKLCELSELSAPSALSDLS